jgi:hypothetical protein
VMLSAFSTFAVDRRELQVGLTGHVFDHLRNIADQAEAAASNAMLIALAAWNTREQPVRGE